jgi:hypothetical protein
MSINHLLRNAYGTALSAQGNPGMLQQQKCTEATMLQGKHDAKLV